MKNPSHPYQDKIERILNELTESDKQANPRIISFIKLWQYSTGGLFDVNEHTDFFRKTNDYSVVQIRKFYKEKYSEELD